MGSVINISKVLFDEKSFLTENFDKAQLLVLDGSSQVEDKSLPGGQPIHPVRRMKSEDFRDWFTYGTGMAAPFILRTEGEPASELGSDAGVKFVFSMPKERMLKMGLTADNVASVLVFFVGKAFTTSHFIFANFTGKLYGAAESVSWSDVQIPEGNLFLPLDTGVEDINVSIDYNLPVSEDTGNIIISASLLNNTPSQVKWAAYAVFCPVELNLDLSTDEDEGPEL